MNKTALVILYLGNPPVFLDLFIKGCTYNKKFDFVFFTDWDYSKYYFSSNCILNTCSKEQFKELTISKLGFPVAVKSSFKLCDYKPTIPFFFEDYLVDYNYVGWCDIDIVFGNLHKFFNEELFSNFDFLTIAKDHISGPFTIMKNERKYTTIFMTAKGWKEIFIDERHYAFDEGLRIEQNSGLDSFSSMMKREENNGNINVLHTLCAYERHPQHMKYRNGSIEENGVEYSMFHFVIAKRNSFFVFPDWKKIPDQFNISKYGFSRIDEKLSFISLFTHTSYRKQVYSNIKKKKKVLSNLIKESNWKNLYIGLKRQIFTKKWIEE